MVEEIGRLFIAVGLPDDTRQLLHRVLGEWNQGRPLPGKVVRPESWHFTLRFLGTTSEVAYERVLAQLDQSDLGPSFRLSLEGLGTFPNPRRATVLWLGVGEGSERLSELAGVAEETAQAAGFDPEDRPFHPHLTLSRIRPHQDLRALVDRTPPDPIRFTVDQITIYRSHLGGGPARYEPLAHLPLRTQGIRPR